MTTASGALTGSGYDSLTGLLGLLTGDEKHEAAAHSTLDVLWVLYDRILQVDPERPDDPGRDRFFLSKGHGPAAYYAVLAAKGFLDVSELSTFGAYDSRLGLHPDGVLLPGVEMGSGSLGHGLGLAVGSALGIRARRGNAKETSPGPRVFCLLGDGELDEGSNHEAIAFAGRIGLHGLTAIVVDNSSASHGWPGGIEARFAVEGWHSRGVNGRDHDALEQALTHPATGRPSVVVAEVEPRS